MGGSTHSTTGFNFSDGNPNAYWHSDAHGHHHATDCNANSDRHHWRSHGNTDGYHIASHGNSNEYDLSADGNTHRDRYHICVHGNSNPNLDNCLDHGFVSKRKI